MRPTSGLGAFVKRCLVVLLLAALALAAWRLMDLALLLFAAVLIAIGLRAGSQWVARSARIGTAGGLVVVVTLFLAALGVALSFFGSVAADQVDELTRQIPAGVDVLLRWLQSLPYGQFVLEKARNATVSGATGWAGATLAGAASSIARGLGYAVLCFVVAVYPAAQPELYWQLCLRTTPAEYRARTELLFDKTDQIFQRWLLARLVVMVAIGALSAIGLWALGVEAAIALGLVDGLPTFIPFVGAILAAAPAILVALTESPVQALLVLLLFISVHFVEGNFITPLVHAEVVALPPVVALLSTVAFTFLFGPSGVLLAVPLTLFLMLVGEVFFRGPVKDPCRRKLNELEITMLKRLAVAALAAGIVLAAQMPTVVAQESTTHQQLSSPAAQAQLAAKFATMTALDHSEIKVHATHSVIHVLLVNTAYNNHPASERDYVASTIAALVAKEAETNPAFERVVSLHVEFVKHGLLFTKTVDIVEFRKGADGAFKRHQT